jgi:hypothetical protein
LIVSAAGSAKSPHKHLKRDRRCAVLRANANLATTVADSSFGGSSRIQCPDCSLYILENSQGDDSGELSRNCGIGLCQSSTGFADPRRMKLGAPSIEGLFARWVGDHKGQLSAIPLLVSFYGTNFRGPRRQGPPRTGLCSWGKKTGPRRWGGFTRAVIAADEYQVSSGILMTSCESRRLCIRARLQSCRKWSQKTLGFSPCGICQHLRPHNSTRRN